MVGWTGAATGRGFFFLAAFDSSSGSLGSGQDIKSRRILKGGYSIRFMLHLSRVETVTLCLFNELPPLSIPFMLCSGPQPSMCVWVSIR